MITCAKVEDLPMALASSTSSSKSLTVSFNFLYVGQTFSIQCSNPNEQVIAYKFALSRDSPYMKDIRTFDESNSMKMQLKSGVEPAHYPTVSVGRWSFYDCDYDCDYD